MKNKLRSEEGTQPAAVLIMLVLVFLIFELTVVGGRLVAAQGAVTNAAREAARRGTLVQSQHEVEAAVDEIGNHNLGNGNLPLCTSKDVTSNNGAGFAPGGSVKVDVFCVVSLSDMGAFGLPLPDIEITASHTEFIETYRAVGDP